MVLVPAPGISVDDQVIQIGAVYDLQLNALPHLVERDDALETLGACSLAPSLLSEIGNEKLLPCLWPLGTGPLERGAGWRRCRYTRTAAAAESIFMIVRMRIEASDTGTLCLPRSTVNGFCRKYVSRIGDFLAPMRLSYEVLPPPPTRQYVLASGVS